MKSDPTILCAPDSFKGTLSASEVADAMVCGIQENNTPTRAIAFPIADGGEGTLDVILANVKSAEQHTARVTGPLGKQVDAQWATISIDEKTTAIIEMAQAAGYLLMPPEQRSPMQTTTFGVGELIRIAAAEKVDEIIITLGGSATVDGGVGALQALGIEFFDKDDRVIASPASGGILDSIERVEIDHDIINSLPPLRIACDVDNPLLGNHGAAKVFGPQKGATPADVEKLERVLGDLANLSGNDTHARPGSGAAGGLGYGLAAFTNATLEVGADLILDLIQFEIVCKQYGVTAIITGEGSFDEQSLSGKAPTTLARRAVKLSIPTFAIVGRRDATVDPAPLRAVFALSDSFGESSAMENAVQCIEQLAGHVARQELD